METLYPLTINQIRQIKQDIADMEVRADEMLHLMAAGCGESDERTLRAQELVAALQRLKWAMDRRASSDGASTSG